MLGLADVVAHDATKAYLAALPQEIWPADLILLVAELWHVKEMVASDEAVIECGALVDINPQQTTEDLLPQLDLSHVVSNNDQICSVLMAWPALPATCLSPLIARQALPPSAKQPKEFRAWMRLQ